MVGTFRTVDGGTYHLGDTVKVSAVGVLLATSGGMSVGREEVLGEKASSYGK